MHSSMYEDICEEQDDVETLKAENIILRRKLQSKSEGLLILAKQVEKGNQELEHYQFLTTHPTNNQILFPNVGTSMARGRGLSTASIREKNTVAMYRELREKNKNLVEERDHLKQQLDDSRGDVSMLRQRLHKPGDPVQKMDTNQDQRQEVVEQLEKITIKYQDLRQDLQGFLDEKEDLVQERDAYKSKVYRLNHQLGNLLKQDHKHILDIDHILLENRYLGERLSRMQEEKDLANQMGRRYKMALENSNQPKIKTGNQDSKQQLQKLIESVHFPFPQNLDIDTVSGLETLCCSILEALADRQLQVRHQRSANRHLAERLQRLETKLETLGGGDLILQPSQVLLKDFNPCSVDKEYTGEVDMKKHNTSGGQRKEYRGEADTRNLNSICKDNLNVIKNSQRNVEEPNINAKPISIKNWNNSKCNDLEKEVPYASNLNEHLKDDLSCDAEKKDEMKNEERLNPSPAVDTRITKAVIKPPDIIDDIPNDILEDVNITGSGMQIVPHKPIKIKSVNYK